MSRYLLGWQQTTFKFAPKEVILRHLGFTGTGIWLIPSLNAYIVILTNRVYSSRLGGWIQQFREDLCASLWSEFFLPLELEEDTKDDVSSKGRLFLI